MQQSSEAPSMGLIRWREFPWAIKACVVAVALVMGLLNNTLHGWGLPFGIAGAGLLIVIYTYRGLWRRARFWVIVLMLTIAQWPLVLVARPLMGKLGFVFNLLFAVMDGAILIGLVWLIQPKAR